MSCLRHQRFDFNDGFRHAVGEDFTTGFGHHHVVLDAHANAAPFLRDVLIVRGDVDARLDGQRHADFQHAPFAADLVLADVMYIHAQPVAGAVHVKRLIGFAGDQFVDLALQQTEFHQPRGNDSNRGFVRLIPVLVRGDFGERCFLRGQDQFVDRFLLGRKLAVDRPGTSDVAGVAIDLATGVDQHQIAVLEQRVILLVMQDAAVAPGGDDRTVGRHLRPALAEFVVEFGFEAVLVEPSPTGLHRTDMSLRRNPCGFAHHLHFCRRFIQAHVVEQMIQGNEFVRRLGTEVRLGADHVDPVHQVTIKFGVAAHRRIHPVAAFDQAREDVVDVGNRKGVVGTKVADRAFLPRAQTVHNSRSALRSRQTVRIRRARGRASGR